MERNHGDDLPDSYRTFLKCFGKRAGDFQKGSLFFYDDLFNLKEEANDLLLENNAENLLGKNAFIFWFHQGYEFFYFNTDEGPDPPVYFYCEGFNEMEKRWDHFSEYLSDTLDRIEKYRHKKSGLNVKQ